MDQKTQPVLQRVAARASITVRQIGGRSRVGRLFQEGAAKIRMPAVVSDPFEAVLINTAGGLTGGDRVTWDIAADAGASAVITTQACEKVYRADSGQAEVTCRLRVGEDARLAWLPQETIVFDRAAFSRTLDVELATGASLLLVEATLFGRLARGERVESGSFRDRWRVRREGRLVHAEDSAFEPGIARTLERSAVAGGAAAIASVLLVNEDAERHLDAAREIVGDAGGASVWKVAGTGKLLARLVAGDGYALRKRLVPLVELLNGRAGLPKVWSL
jgi:urease accessory protein